MFGKSFYLALGSVFAFLAFGFYSWMEGRPHSLVTMIILLGFFVSSEVWRRGIEYIKSTDNVGWDQWESNGVYLWVKRTSALFKVLAFVSVLIHAFVMWSRF